MNKANSKFANQPSNIGEGLVNGYEALLRQLKESKDNIVVVPMKHYREHGYLNNRRELRSSFLL